ncbi:hypothetical protein [Sphingomonas paucimobilis]|uniref:DUF3168 domain-containing protein n=1 Tax=Sphingomonas paucimobilis TaxID=13689 RepID=A0A7T3ABY9_SPHPI|nr:hypothetical protein [Sphingomonas paucimobilis]QPT09875.1 hypothetical protein I6G38_06440 [Sphingomonas paucimobilis]
MASAPEPLSPLVEPLKTIAALQGRIYGAAKLEELARTGGLAQVTPAAYTLGLGVVGGDPDAASGLYRQSVVWLEGVVLVVRSAGDATGAAGLQQLRPLIHATIEAIAGLDPPDSPGVWRLVKGELFSLQAGCLTYQLDFAIDDQLRIAR